MPKANDSVDIINDEIIRESKNSNKSLLTEITCKDAYQRIYSKFVPEDDYRKIIAAVQDNDNFLSGDARWVLGLYKKKGSRIIEDLYKLRTEFRDGYLQIFNRLKETGRLTPEQADLNKYKSISELGAFTSQWDIEDVWASAEELKKRVMRQEFIDAKDDIDVLFEDEVWLVITPKSYEASAYWGDRTEWCTAYKDSRKYYDSYTSEGPLYININKHTKEKFQFHFETNSFMYSNDKEIEYPVLSNIEATEGLLEFYTELTFKNGEFNAYFSLCAPKRNDDGELFGVTEVNGNFFLLNYSDQ
jgi:hypothetical protein